MDTSSPILSGLIRKRQECEAGGMTSQSASTIADMCFYDLEIAMLDVIAAQYPTQRDELLAQFRSARVTQRHNSGVGVFTYFEVDRHKAPPVTVPRIFGNVWADIDGFEVPMTFLAFAEDGYANCLGGATCGDETGNVDFSQVQFRLRALLRP